MPEITAWFWILKLLTTAMGEAASDYLAVAATFWIWHRRENTLDVHSITTRRREVFCWVAVSFTFALGTAAGDLTASQLHFGFLGSIVLFAIVIAVPALGCWRFHLNSVIAFWWAYIVTRPLGASIADWFSKPAKAGALAYGDGPVAAALLVIALILVTFVAVRPANVMNPGQRSLQLGSAKSPNDAETTVLRTNSNNQGRHRDPNPNTVSGTH